jgi:TonB family protein
VRGALDKEIIRRVIRRHLNEVRFCYEKELVRTPTLAGRLTLQFTINAAGQVIAATVPSSTLNNPALESCAVAAVKAWEFPKTRGDGTVVVNYPFVLSPSSN